MSTTNHEESENVRGKSVPRVILVTGATGNVGRHVVSQLLHAGATVRALARGIHHRNKRGFSTNESR